MKSDTYVFYLYFSGKAIAVPAAQQMFNYVTSLYLEYLISNVACSGAETDIEQCAYEEITTNECATEAGVICVPSEPRKRLY